MKPADAADQNFTAEISPILSVQDLSVSYGQVKALRQVSIDVYAGEAVALVGANGAGKTTLFRTIVGHLKPQHGSIAFASKHLRGVPTHRRIRLGLGYSPEGRRLFPGLTVRENLEVAIFDNARIRKERIDFTFSLFPVLASRQASPAWQLSGGQQQMVAIARALVGRPKLLLLDEPSLGLSPKLADEVMLAVRDVVRAGTSVLLAEQNVSRSLACCDRAYVLEVGQVVLSGSSDSLRSSEAIRKAYLGG